MDAIGKTDLDWFEKLRGLDPTPARVNFWTPTPWTLAKIGPGSRWYFMLKAPVRKIGGVGTVESYEIMPISEAWERFGTGNGVASLDELRDRTRKYAERRATERIGDDYEIGCIILTECEFWDEADYLEPERDLGTPMPDQVVTFKYIVSQDEGVTATEGSPSGFVFQPGAPGQGTGPTTRKGTDETTVERLHAQIQKSLYAQLVEQHGRQHVRAEQPTASGRPADIMVQRGEQYSIYEIKTASTAKDCVRDALGQLLEYAYWPGSPEVSELWVVGPVESDPVAEQFLSDLRAKFGLPLQYLQHGS